MNLEESLEGLTSILLDSAPVIYYFEKNPRYIPLMDRFVDHWEKSELICVTSPITLAECLIHPKRLGLSDLVESYKAQAFGGDKSRFRMIGSREADLAAEIRGKHNLTLDDAFQVAVAVTAGCQAILTNDRVFARVEEVRAIVLDDLEE